jgi:hypothetical protein
MAAVLVFLVVPALAAVHQAQHSSPHPDVEQLFSTPSHGAEATASCDICQGVARSKHACYANSHAVALVRDGIFVAGLADEITTSEPAFALPPARAPPRA